MAKKRKAESKPEPEPEPELEEPAPVEEAPPADAEMAEKADAGDGDTQVTQDAVEEEDGEDEADEKDGEDEADEEDGEEDGEEGIQNLLEPFGKDQLIELLVESALKHADVVDRINQVADVDPSHRKIFVHGLGWDTTAETLKNAFKKYGEIEDCNAVTDKISGKSKGYGFILFKHRSGARKALKEPQKKIGNRMTACQLASAGPVPATPPVSEYTQRKIYVSNVSADIDPQKLLHFFSKYGEIIEGPLGLDKQTGKPKGFTLFVYKTIESAKRALEDPHKNFEGHILHCQKAIDGPKPPKVHHHNLPSSHQGFHRNESTGGGFGHGIGNLGTSGSGGNPLMSGGLGFNQAAAAPVSLNPALGQALTALLATQGGLGLTNVLASLNPALNPNLSSAVNQNVPSPLASSAPHGAGVGGFGNQPGGNANLYGNQAALSYQNSGGRSQQAGGPMGGVPPYLGH